MARRVALKVLPLHAARDASLLERFQREAKAAARLHHTNIVPVRRLLLDEAGTRLISLDDAMEALVWDRRPGLPADR